MSRRGIIAVFFLLDEAGDAADFYASANIDRPLLVNKFYVPCIDAPVFSIDYRTSINTTGVGGRSIPSLGSMTIHNDDGSLDFLASRITSGKKVQVYFGPPDNEEFGSYFGVLDTLLQLVARLDDSLAWNEQQFTIAIRDGGILFNTPIQTHTYAGTGALEGPPELKGNVKPVAFGSPRNVPPVEVDRTEGFYVYQCHDGAFTLTEVYDRGIPYGSDNFDLVVDVYSWAPVGGRVAVDEAHGIFRLGSLATGIVTADFTTTDGIGFVSAITDSHVAFATNALYRANLIGTAANQIVLKVDTLAALEGEITGRVSFYSAQKTTVAAVLDQIAISFGGFWSVDRFNNFTMGRLRLPRLAGWSAADFVIEKERVVSIERTEADPPAWEYKLNYDRCFRPMTESDYQGSSATPAFKNAVAQEWRSQTANFATTKEHYAPGREIAIDTLFKNSTDITIDALLYLELNPDGDVPIPRDHYVVGVRGIFGRVNLGNIVELQYDRFGLNQGVTQTGKLFLVLGVKEEPDVDSGEDLTTLTLWGGLAYPIGYEP